jgi:hypothetical protein
MRPPKVRLCAVEARRKVTDAENLWAGHREERMQLLRRDIKWAHSSQFTYGGDRCDRWEGNIVSEAAAKPAIPNIR